MHPGVSRLMMQRRPSQGRLSGVSPIPYQWKIERISSMMEGKYMFSPSFYLDGYWFRLQAGRIK